MGVRASSFCAGVLVGALVIVAVPVEAQQQHNNVILRTVKYRGGPTISTDMDRAMLKSSFEARSHLFSRDAKRKGSKFMSQGVGMGKASLKGMARVARSGLGYPLVAFTAAMAAIDYFFMPEKSPPDWYKSRECQGQECDFDFSPNVTQGGDPILGWHATREAACEAHEGYLDYYDCQVDPNGDDWTEYSIKKPGTGTHHYHFLTRTKELEVPDKRLTAEEAWQALRDSGKFAAAAEHLAKIAAEGSQVDENGDLQDNPVASEWTELQDAIDNIEAAIQAAEEAADLNNDGVLDQSELDQAPEFDLDQLPDTPPQEQPTFNIDIDIPTGCDLLPQVCEIRDWLFEEPTEEPPEPDWVVEEIDQTDLPDADNDLPSDQASCPSDTFEVFGITINTPYQPFCDLATKIKPLVIGMAWLVAVMIVVRDK